MRTLQRRKTPPLRQDPSEANAARHDEIAVECKQQRDEHGLYQHTADVHTGMTDADATPLRLKGGGHIWATGPMTSSMAASDRSS